jgi:tRNA-dihydrouridine synthase B
VVRAAAVPVTLKIRTGWAREHRNGVAVARIAEDCGIAALAVHGRTREDLYGGQAEYDTIAAIKQAIRLPVWANGDIDSPEKALRVLQQTGADGLMIGRAAQGRPWIFRQIQRYLAERRQVPAPTAAEIGALLLEHLDALYALYGEDRGVRVVRKHIQWYCRDHAGSAAFWARVSGIESASEQRQAVAAFFEAAAADLPVATAA